MSAAEGREELNLRAVAVRPTWGAQEQRRWDRLAREHHYLSFQALFGQAVRHVATLGETWIALLGWQEAALRVTARDRWIGWTEDQKRQRLHLVRQNSRFVILPGWRVRNLASRVLGLSLRRLSGDMQAAYGYPALLAESFVESARFAGTCYRAANWRALGLTSGYARQSRGKPDWLHHGQAKEVFVYELQSNARAALCRGGEERGRRPEPQTGPQTAQLRSLWELLGEVQDYRGARGQRYSLRTALTVAVAGRLAGYRGVTALAEYGAQLSQEQRREIGCFYSPSRQMYTTPSTTTLHNILSRLPPDTLQKAVSQWSLQKAQPARKVQPNEDDTGRSGDHGKQAGPLPALAIDGKDVRCASKQTENGRRMLVAAVEHGSGLVLGQHEIDSKTNEIPAVRELAEQLDLAGRVVTVDALHAQHETARHLLKSCRADYVVTAIKGNQPTMLADLQSMAFQGPAAHETLEKAHGRIDRRRYWIQDLSDSSWKGRAALYGRRQAIRIERRRYHLKNGKQSTQVTYALTSLSCAAATPEQLAELVRNHWHIENRLHYVRDFTYDEDRCRAFVRQLPHNLASLTNAAISLIRCQTKFPHVPKANRYFAAQPQAALDLILTPPAR